MERTPSRGGFEGYLLEAAAKEPVEVGLPLLNQMSGTHHQGALDLSQALGLSQPKARHDRLAGSRFVGQQESQPRLRQHLPIHSRHLMRVGTQQAGSQHRRSS